MTSNYERVKEFHSAFEIQELQSPGFPTQNVIDLRLKLIDEEFQELRDATDANDIVEAADAHADLLYVIYGTAAQFGIHIRYYHPQITEAVARLPSKHATDQLFQTIDTRYNELKAAIVNRDVQAVTNALYFLLISVYDSADSYGIPINACFIEVHASNMTKLGDDGKPVRREDGKVLKGPNFRLPELKPLLGLEKANGV